MKKLILTIILIMSTFIGHSQDIKSIDEDVKRTVIQIGDNYYSIRIEDASGTQTGYLIMKEGSFSRTGIWRKYDIKDELISSGVFEDGRLKTITIYEDSKTHTFDMTFIQRIRSSKKMANN